MIKVIICILLTFTALGIACAVGLALRRSPEIGRRARPTPADPFSIPYSAGLALRPEADGGRLTVPSWFAPISQFFGRHRHG